MVQENPKGALICPHSREGRCPGPKPGSDPFRGGGPLDCRGMRLGRFSCRLFAGLAGVVVPLLLAPAALAADGVGVYGRTDDKVVTYFAFGVIAFFAILVTVLSLIQIRLENRKERRTQDLERLGSR